MGRAMQGAASAGMSGTSCGWWGARRIKQAAMNAGYGEASLQILMPTVQLLLLLLAFLFDYLGSKQWSSKTVLNQEV